MGLTPRFLSLQALHFFRPLLPQGLLTGFLTLQYQHRSQDEDNVPSRAGGCSWTSFATFLSNDNVVQVTFQGQTEVLCSRPCHLHCDTMKKGNNVAIPYIAAFL